MNRSVELDVAGFCIDRHEATVRDYTACVDAGACVPITRMLVVRTLGNVCNAHISGREDHPINCMTFDEAARYCGWRGARLPRSSEWELAAEGSPARSYPWGEALPDATRLNACGLESPERDRYAQTYLEQDAWPTTAPVGSFPGGATPEGVHDLLGNACEWVQDDRPRSDRTQLLRGSGFLDRPELSTQALLARPPGYEGRSNGVRCAR
jgi:formylglycine-generating enzyme required for sulfatase activity